MGSHAVKTGYENGYVMDAINQTPLMAGLVAINCGLTSKCNRPKVGADEPTKQQGARAKTLSSPLLMARRRLSRRALSCHAHGDVGDHPDCVAGLPGIGRHATAENFGPELTLVGAP